MEPKYVNKSMFASCIKIGGTAILPPLITEERRQELIEDKAKAIEIEKKLKRKRSSIDSGVMTGSYIDSFKSSQFQINETSLPCQLSISDLTLSEKTQPCETIITSELNNISSDNFLRSALEDSEFRDFFYSTAERIFNENNSINVNQQLPNHIYSCESSDVDHVCIKTTDELNRSEMSLNLSNYLLSNDLLDIGFCDNLTVVRSAVGSIKVNENQSSPLQVKEQLFPPQRLVRRNSYTLEGPSPVLVEHMAKEKSNCKSGNERWKSLSDKKEKVKGPGFKTFSSDKKQRKTWNKNISDHSVLKISSQCSKNLRFPIKRSKTFSKGKIKGKETNYSLPCSSRTSPVPIHLSNITYSADCIQSLIEKAPKFIESNMGFNVDIISEPIKEVKSPCKNKLEASPVHDHGDSILSHKDMDSKSTNLSTLEIPTSPHSTCDIDTLFPSLLYYPNDSASLVSGSVHCTFPQQKELCDKNTDNLSVQSKRNHYGEIDESFSICSSLSLSKFMPLEENVSRPLTTENLTVSFSELLLQHEREITELLEKQHKEKVMLSKAHSYNESLSSRNTTNLSVCDLPYENTYSPSTSIEEKKVSCNRELFPTQKSSPLRETPCISKDISEKEKAAATKITAYARGYLTRRLLKTEKVQQLIDLIKESLNFAFSLQSETQLKRNDLDFYERLAHQLSAALYELQTITSAPTAKRMAIIAADREKLRKPSSGLSTAISAATQKSLLRRQQSFSCADKQLQESRTRTKSLSINNSSGLIGSSSVIKSETSSVTSTNSNRKPWR